MFERFTEKAIKVMTDAQDAAWELKHAKLCPEHILLGIVKQKSGIASKFLKAGGLNIENTKEEVRKNLQEYETQNPPEILPFSDDLKALLKKTWDKSIDLQTHFIVPEHLFLCMIEAKDSNVYRYLNEFDIDLKRIKISVEKILIRKEKTKTHPEFKHKSKQWAQKYQSIPSIFEEASSINLMNFASEKLKESKFEMLGTDQIMLALLEKGGNNLSEILQNEGVNQDDFNQKLSQLTSREDEYNKECMFTPKAYTALNSAFEIAKQLGSASILPEHIILGILKEKGGVAYKLLNEMGVDTNNIYDKILNPIKKQRPVTMTIIQLAKEEARRLGHNMVGSELILLGIIGEGAGVGAEVLNELGITTKDVRKEVEKIIGFGNEYLEKEIDLSIRAKRIIEFAWTEVKKSNKPHIESEHLLLGIINEKGCVANKVLENLGVDALEIKQGILNRTSK